MGKQYIRVANPTKGLDYRVPSTMIDSHATPSCSEVRLESGVVEKVAGTTAFAGTVATPLTGTVMAFNYLSPILICHTTTDVYTLTATASTSKTDVAGPYTGTIANPISSVWMYVTGEAKNYYIFANGKDRPRKWDLATATVTMLANTDTKIPAWISCFGGRLCMYNVVDGNADMPVSVYYSAPGAPEDYTSVSSGYTDLYAQLGGSSQILRAERIGDNMIVYGDHSIALQMYTQAANYPFAFYGAIPNVGLAAPRALLNINNSTHIFLGWDDIYTYSGGANVERVGGPIKDELFSIIDPSAIGNSFITYLGHENRARLHIPKVGSTVPDVYFEYNLGEQSWTRGTRTYSGCGDFQVTSTLTWASIADAWDDFVVNWDSGANVQGSPLTLYGDASGLVYRYPTSLYSLAGAAIISYFDTPDFVGEEEYRKKVKTWYSLEFEGKGNSVDVSYSVDAGLSFTALETVTLANDFAVYRVDLDVTSTQLRFRFANSTANENFNLRWYEVGFYPGSEYYRND